MANITIAAGTRATHDHQLAANTADTITIGPEGAGEATPPIIEIASDGTAKIYAAVDGTAATIGGANCYLIPAAISTLQVELEAGSTTLSLISAGTPTYSVTKVSWR